MKTYIAILSGILMCLLIVAPAQAQQPPNRPEAFEREIANRLTTINPAAVPIFQQATLDMDADRLAEAKRGYEQVLQLAPDFPDALRRLSYVEQALKNLDDAETLARRAVQVQNSPENLTALARILLATQDKTKTAEALGLAQTAAQVLPNDEYTLITLVMAGAYNNNEQVMRQGITGLVRAAPQNPVGHYFAGLLAAQDSQWEKAEGELLLSQKLGMPPEEVQKALDEGISSQARFRRIVRWSLYSVGGWLGGLAALFLTGSALSLWTLRAVRQPQPDPNYRISFAERLIRNIYRVVIGVTSAYFYISIPFVILAVTALAGGIFYMFLAIGHIPIQLSLMIGLATLYTLYAVIRSIFARVKDQEPARHLSREEAPRLWSLAEQVAERVGARAVDVIYVTPAVEIAVTESGSLLRRVIGKGKRCLILGLGALPDLAVGQFQAILAHEYGHFVNRDTAGGNLARQAHVSIKRMAYGLARHGQTNWYNPAWIFVNVYHRIFLRITLGASRLQEILADRYAAIAYGVQNFAQGLQHIVRQDIAFSMLVEEQAVTRRMKLQGIYATPIFQSNSLNADLDKKYQETISRPTSLYDSHPAVHERIELVQQLNTSGGSGWGSQEPVWSLLPNAEQLQSEMTAIIQGNIDRK